MLLLAHWIARMFVASKSVDKSNGWLSADFQIIELNFFTYELDISTNFIGFFPLAHVECGPAGAVYFRRWQHEQHARGSLRRCGNGG
jgi:hypothetical protein